MIPVSRPWLPSFEEFASKLEDPWRTGILTHNGPLVQEFEKRLQDLWGVKNVIAVSNGTMAIQLALRALRVSGEVVTTPFTWHATATAAIWEGCSISFVDIEEESLCLDPEKVEQAISKKTGAIIPVNVYGNPPNFSEFDRISEKFGIPIIYDAAHAACTKQNGKSTFHNGHISTTSFHATKYIHTGEGGACITNDDETAEKLRSLRFFGFETDGNVGEFGTNAKMTEVHAALGLCCLDNLDIIRERRESLERAYISELEEIGGIELRNYNSDDFEGNSLYMPVSFESEETLERVVASLNSSNYFPRRYFSPSLNMISTFGNGRCPVSEDISKRILCLPLFVDLNLKDVREIVEIIKKNLE